MNLTSTQKPHTQKPILLFGFILIFQIMYNKYHGKFEHIHTYIAYGSFIVKH